MLPLVLLVCFITAPSVLAACAAGSYSIPGTCLPGWVTSEGSSYCYASFATTLTWAGAAVECAGRAPGGTLASIRNRPEALIVQGFSGWIGLNDLAFAEKGTPCSTIHGPRWCNGGWAWQRAGVSSEYITCCQEGWGLWNSYEPNNYGGNEHCVVSKGLDGLNDVPCAGMYGAEICEAPKTAMCSACPAGYFCLPGSDPFLCPAGWTAPIGSQFCFSFSPSTTLSWERANTQCSLLAPNGTLASIRSQSEAAKVSALSASPLCFGLSSARQCSVSNGGAFIGLYSSSDCRTSRTCETWKWARAGVPNSFILGAGQSLWCGFEPNGGVSPLYVQWMFNDCMNDHENEIDTNFIGGFTCEAPQAGVCPPGFYCPPSSSAPIPCPQNSFSASWGASIGTACLPCPVGFCSSKGSALCSTCPLTSVTPTTSNSGTPSPSPTAMPTTTPSTTLSVTGTSSTTFTGTYSNSPSQTPSSTPTLSSTPTPLTCAPGTFVAPGTYACARCPPGSFSAASGPTTSCTSCAPLMSTLNATSCAPCPPLQRSNASGSCEACPLGHFCDGTGADLFCQPPIDVCLGALQGCRAGHAGFMCASCAPGFFKSPSSYCTPCTSGFFVALPAILASVVVVPLVFWLFSANLAYLSAYVMQLRVELSKYDITLSVISDQLLRLSLLRRVASFQLPSVFGWLTGFVSLVFGFNAMGSGAECIDPSWSFLKTFVTVFGVSGALTAATLLFDLCTYRLAARKGVQQGALIGVSSWRVWDTLAFVAPFAVQTSWEALTHLNINGQERLWNSPSTPWDPFSATSVVAGCTIAFQFFFILFRYMLPCTLSVKHSIEEGKEVVRPENDSSSKVVIERDLLFTSTAKFRVARNLLAFLRSCAIPLQMSSTLAPAVLLVSLSAVDLALALALAFASPSSLVDELALLGRKDGKSAPVSNFWQAVAWVLILAVFSATQGSVIACTGSGACSSLTGLGIALLLLNVLPFAAFIVLILRSACYAISSDSASALAGDSDGVMTPRPTQSNKHLLANINGKAVLLVPSPPPKAWATFRAV